MVMRRAVLASGISITLAGLVTRVAAQGAPQGMQNRSYEDGFTVLASDRRFSTWVEILQMSGDAPYARGVVPYTMFAPTNAAINKRPDIREMLLPTASQAFPDTTGLLNLVREHVVTGLHPLDEFKGKKVTLRSVAGTPIEVDATNPQAIAVTWQSFEGQKAHATLEGPPILANNADIYPIDTIVLKRH
ncbi:MAG: fasciclin domain-containing protein [Acetobacteraceae bacterium]|nr:fasciclin domain-containing protein [Acetobacteraceae bacterium]